MYYFALYLKPEPGNESLEGTVSTAPSVIVKLILHVVVVGVSPLDHSHLEASDFCRDMAGVKA